MDLRDELIKSASHVPMLLKTSLKNLEGSLSRGQFEGLRCLTMSVKEETDTRSKFSKVNGVEVEEGAGSKREREEGDLIEAILVLRKNGRNLSHSTGDGTIPTDSQGFKRELRVFKRNRFVRTVVLMTRQDVRSSLESSLYVLAALLFAALLLSVLLIVNNVSEALSC